jgi:transposase
LVATLQEQLKQALGRIEELEKKKTPPPSFVKANKPKTEKAEKKARKKRAAIHNRGRKQSEPTERIEHRLVECPDCHLRLGGLTLARVREVIDVPEQAQVEVRHHQVYQGWCSGCQKWHEAPLDLSTEVVGQGRIGVRITSLIAYLRTVMRLPFRQIQQLLHTLYGFVVSLGELVEVLHRLREHSQAQLQELKGELLESPAIQADETGWREDGINGYIWSISTPTVRYYEYHHSRAGDVVRQLIGEDYQGVLGSDFYAGYNVHEGLHQRCWAHFLRDAHELKEESPDDQELFLWVKQVKDLYHEALDWIAALPDPTASTRSLLLQRKQQQTLFEQHLLALCRPFVQTSTPQHTLCERVERFLPELFVFVGLPGVPAHNNLAERSVRPLVIARKISGGTRSPKGSLTRMGLASLFGTWMAQGLNPFHQCLALLTSKTSLEQ